MIYRLFPAFLLALTLSAQQPSLRWLSQSLQRLVDQVSPAVVQISVEGLGGRNERPAIASATSAEAGRA